ncbi:alpha-D-ribose 1-methylphosphonate 5-triphosphate diphosphatase [Allopusillimonas soli]|uniref:Alpha-D-ribose 1-methylphosphonate 5-triphosphate diphosphatase n=1 Tax=Allopusillimonas soli TaxID=659016 RepID=A0A853FG20_9BURK|nr:alpha-D-ribose 1-methylphosphonate 5-triphosphate diphosphatase [Allopusillimonas soli]NYT37431.1 alpha-D-ribose 1-methylphosphonate 5-triphosphate diphosphatase [Allopusillimonas soli]TEA74587.1 alpha-D-ribose 1-methylphosphonate 5-triphosphate diphosphatase [Allopusillimonas soli]
MPEHIFTNAWLVTATDVLRGTIAVRDGLIHDVSESASSLPHAQDMNGDYLMPGFVELHTDNLEKFMNPRPGVDWPSESAILAHDAQVVAAGITTVFDALSIGDINPGGSRLRQLPLMLKAIRQAASDGHTRAEHRLHLRCELSQEKTLDVFRDLVGSPLVQLVSVMDHSPGQRQFVKMEKYREYYQGKYHLSDTQMETFIGQQLENSRRYSDIYRRAIVDECRRRTLSIASHDDATVAHARESAEFGMSIAEFPTTMEAASASHAFGLKVLMGAPNIVRGGSHSGNVSARMLAEQDVLDILSSDYYPSSLLQAVGMLAHGEIGYDLPRAVACVSLAPARAAGLADRGEIRPGLRADLIRARPHEERFVVGQVWRGGERVF